MALRTRFDPQPKGKCFFSDGKRDEAYFHAGPYFLEQLRILLEYGWKHNGDHNSEEVSFFYQPSVKQYSTHYFIIAIIRYCLTSISQ